MKSLLKQIGLPVAVGLQLDDRQMTLSEVAATPIGCIEIGRHQADLAVDGEAEELISQVLGRNAHRIPIAVSLPCDRVFFSTRPIQANGSNAAPRVLLRETLQSAGVSIDDMVVDVVKSQPRRRPLASIVASTTKDLNGLMQKMRSFGVTPFRVEPEPCALLRAAVHQARTPRRATEVLRVFLGNDRGLAIVAVNDLPIVWREFNMPRGDEARAILSASRPLQVLGQHCGIESNFDVVMIHGREDLQRVVDYTWLLQQLAVEVHWVGSPALDPNGIAFGLALGCLKQTGRDFDLARTVKPVATLRELFPWREVAVHCALLCGLGWYLYDRLLELRHSHEMLQIQYAGSPQLATATETDLERERKELLEQVSAIKAFCDSRVVWTSFTRDLAARLPQRLALTAIQGESPLERPGKKKKKGTTKKSLVLRGSVHIPLGGSVPRGIDDLLNSLRSDPLLKDEFPTIELAEFRRARGGSTADFTVVCLPKNSKPK